MTALTWQALLFLAAAYFAGCCLGCILRRIFWPPRVAVPEAVTQSAAATASQAAGAAATLSRSTVETRPHPVTQEPVHRVQPIETTVAAERETVAVTAPARKEEPRVEVRPADRQPAPAATPVARVEEKATVAAPDDLERIHLIDAVVESKLNALGVRRFAEIAQWTASDVARIGKELGFKGRIQNENWIEQAQILAKGGETHYARRLAQGEIAFAQVIGDEGEPPPVAVTREKGLVSDSKPEVADRSAFAVERAPPRDGADDAATAVSVAGGEAKPARATDVSGLRSVRSEALRAPDKPPASGIGSSRRIGLPSDLKRIRGIGVLIEKRLHSLGVTSYEHIANWTASDIDRISQTLDFKGRIERENWVEQARILAAGGQTEFSRRFDRGGGQV